MIFKQIKDCPNFEISENGDVRNIKTKRILKPQPYKGYLRTSVCKKNYTHKLVAITFIDNPLNFKNVVHIDGCKTNNNVKNLKWQKQVATLRGQKGAANWNSKLTDNDVMEIKKLILENKLSIKEISEQLNISYNIIYNVKNGISWTHIKS